MIDIDLPLPAVIHTVQSDNTVTLFNRTRAQSTVKHIHKFLCAILDLDYGPRELLYSIVSTDFDIWKPSLKEEWKEFWICAGYFYLGEHRAEKTTYLAKNELQWCILILAFLALVSKMQQRKKKFSKTNVHMKNIFYFCFADLLTPRSSKQT